MSLILKGIDMPKEGEWLEVIIKPTKEVIVDTIRYRDNALLKTEYESAIQIPRGHGRLIDAKLFADTICQAIQSGDLIQKSIWEWIADVPTILEAEGEEDEQPRG